MDPKPDSEAPAFDDDITLESLPDTERYLLEMVHQEPGHDEPRMVYADWLLENDDPRGELIALQCTSPANDPDTQARLQHLCHTYYEQWLGPIGDPQRPPPVVSGNVLMTPARDAGDLPLCIERGFLARPLCVTSSQVAEAADALHRLSPTLYEVPGQPMWQGVESQVYAASARGPAGSLEPVAIKRSQWAIELDSTWAFWDHVRSVGAKMHANELAMGCAAAHPNVVRYLGQAYWGAYGDPALVMEWIDGWSLRELIQTPSALPAPVSVAIAGQILLALSHLHTGLGRGEPDFAAMSHGEVKPDHVMIDRQGVVKLVDFSWAQSESVARPYPRATWRRERTRGRDERPRWRSAYLSPQVVGGLAAGPADDTYSVGVMLYELLCGVHPFVAPSARSPGDNRHQIADAVIQGDVVPPNERTQMPAELEAIIMQSLARQPEWRYRTATTMLEALSAVIDDHGWRTSPAAIAHWLRSAIG